MTPAARIAAVIHILDLLYDADWVAASAARVLRSGMQRRRYAGSSDRNAISALFWKIQRNLARLCWHIESADADINGRSLVLAALVLLEGQGDALASLFSAEAAHSALPLSKTELKLARQLEKCQFDDPSMPQHILLEWPEWLMADTASALGHAFAANLLALTLAAPTDIRFNPIKIAGQRKLRDRLAGRGLQGHLTNLSPLGVRLQNRIRFDDLKDWKKGLFEIQDEGSQLASLLCDARPGMQVADICAGACGKSLVMAAMMKNKGRILALDRYAKRLDKGGERLRRAGIHNVERKVVAEKWSSRSWRGKFDRVVVDAPCSGSGTWRRQVDGRWLLTPDKLEFYQETQAILLDKARAMVAPGGRIIYITCSVLASEGVDQINKFLLTAPNLEPADIGDIWADTIGAAGGGVCPPHDAGCLQLLPSRDGTDGFFIAVLQAKLQ